MDPISQAALGAGWAEPAARGKKIAAAALIGGLAAMTPDLDFLIYSPDDPLLTLEYHRHFTHGLVFIPFGALISACAFHWIFRRRLTFRESFVFCLLAYASHGLLDACTTYGTQLLWPFSDYRAAWHIVSAVDPLFTVPVLALVVFAALRRQARWSAAALAWAVLYLAFAWLQSTRAEAVAAELARSRGHAPARLEVMPAFGTTLLWRSIYEQAGRYHVDAVRVGPAPKVFPGTSIAKLDIERHLPWLDPRSQQALDIERFRWFTDDYLALSGEDPAYVIDLRYSLVPNGVDGLWGVKLDPLAGADEHVAYLTARSRPLAEGQRLLEMLFQ